MLIKSYQKARLGITNFFIKEGLVTLEEVRAKDGSLENAYIRVRPLSLLSIQLVMNTPQSLP